MRLAIILDPLPGIKAYKDSTVAMMREAVSRRHEIFVIQQEEVWLKAGEVHATARALAFTEDLHLWYRVGAAFEAKLDGFDVVLMRKDPPFDLEYLYSTYLLEIAEAAGARVFNRAQALRDYNEKLGIMKFPELIPPTLVTRDEAHIRQFLEKHGDIILKPLDGMGGSSVFRLHRHDPNVGVVIETLTHHGRRTIMAQRFIPEISAGDKRILLIDGEPVAYALARIPKPGETRANLAAGGKGVAQPLSPRDQEIAGAIGPTVRAEGLLLVGLDVIGDYLTEINVTSPTGMQEITKQTGINVAGMMIDALERAVAGN
jgi:glutathione synthase